MATTMRTVCSGTPSTGIQKATSSRKYSHHLSACVRNTAWVGNAAYCSPFTQTTRQSLSRLPTQLSAPSRGSFQKLEQGHIAIATKNGKICAAAAGAASPMDKGKEPGGAWLEKLTGAHSPPAGDIMWAALGKSYVPSAVFYWSGGSQPLLCLSVFGNCVTSCSS